VCLPVQAIEWVETSKKWNMTFLYEFGNLHSTNGAFNHPNFDKPQESTVPMCTPLNTLKVFSEYNIYTSEKYLSQSSFKLITDLYYLVALVFGKFFSMKVKLVEYAKN
jgi:hypothetical protein